MKDDGGGLEGLGVVGLYLCELEQVCAQIGTRNVMLLLHAGGEGLALSAQAASKATRQMRELEVLGVFLCGVILEVLRDRARDGTVMGGGGGGRGVEGAQTVGILKHVVVSAEYVLSAGPQVKKVTSDFTTEFEYSL